MRKSPLFVNMVLCVLLGATLLCAIVVRAAAPQWILPKLNIPAIAALSLLALVVQHYCAPSAPRHYGLSALYSALTFALLPWCSAYLPLGDALRAGVVGGATFTAVMWLFTVITRRLRDSHTSPAAPVICALGLYLAAQGFMGILL